MNGDETPSSRENKAFALLTKLVLAALVTAAGVQYSLQHGRLICRPMADDGNYMVDGLGRLNVLQNKGLLGLLHSLAADAPHAPFSSLLAMASFGIFGRHDWTPYAGNFVVVLSLLCVVDWLLGNVRAWQRGLVLALVLTTRLPLTAVVEFRPDIAAALATATAVLFALRTPLLASPMRHRLAAGGLVGLSLLIKPSMAPVNALLLILTLIAVLLIERPRPLLRAAGAISPAILVALAITLPYYVVGWRVSYRYIYDNVFGSRKDLWHYNKGWIANLFYYLDVPGGRFMLGSGQAGLLVALALAGLILVLCPLPWYSGGGLGWGWRLRRASPPPLPSPGVPGEGERPREHRLRAAAMTAIAVAAYAIPTIAKTKNVFFGANFQMMLLMGGVLTLRMLARMPKPAAQGAVAAVCLAGALMFQPPLSRGNHWDQDVAGSNRLLNDVYGHLRANAAIGDRVFVPAPGKSVSSNTMAYLSLLDDSGLRFVNLDFGKWNDQAMIDEELDLADWVVLGEPGNDERRADVYNGRDEALGLYLRMVRQRHDFADPMSYPTAAGKRYYIFHRVTPALEDIGPVEAGQSAWRLPRFYRGMSGTTSVPIVRPPGRYAIVMACESWLDDQTITILLNGQEVIAMPLNGDRAIVDGSCLVNLPVGLNWLQIKYGRVDEASKQPLVFLTKLQVLGK